MIKLLQQIGRVCDPQVENQGTHLISQVFCQVGGGKHSLLIWGSHTGRGLECSPRRGLHGQGSCSSLRTRLCWRSWSFLLCSPRFPVLNFTSEPRKLSPTGNPPKTRKWQSENAPRSQRRPSAFNTTRPKQWLCDLCFKHQG